MCIDQRTPGEPFAEVVAALFPSEHATETVCAPAACSSRRRRLWEIPGLYHCAIIGTCLPVGELRRLARRAGVAQWSSESDYELHHAAVDFARDRNALSTLMHKALETRYAAHVRRFAACRTGEDLVGLWKQALARGDVAGALWGLMSHAHAADDVLDFARYEAELARSIEHCELLQAKLEALQGERDASEAGLRELLPGLCDAEPGLDCPPRCAGLAGRRVLCVGGRAGCVEHYRALIERSRGGFVHHDGGVEHSAKRLHALLAASDAVICVAGHVSHGAYYVVKRFCKKHEKPCVLLKSAGLSSFLSGIHALTRTVEGGAGLPDAALN